MPAFLNQYGTHVQSEAALTTVRWSDGIACPTPVKRSSCSLRCRSQRSVIGDDNLKAAKPPRVRWFLAMHLLVQAKGFLRPLEFTGELSCNTAWLIKRRMMKVMRLRGASRHIRSGLESDNACLDSELADCKTGCDAGNKPPSIIDEPIAIDGNPVVTCVVQQPVAMGTASASSAKSAARPLAVLHNELGYFTVAESVGVRGHLVSGGRRAGATSPQHQMLATQPGDLTPAITHCTAKLTERLHRSVVGVQSQFSRHFESRSTSGGRYVSQRQSSLNQRLH